MWNFLVEVDYQDLAQHLEDTIEQDSFFDDTIHSFEVTHHYLTLKTRQFMDFNYQVSGSDQELLDILMRHHTVGTVTEITVTSSPAIVLRVNDQHMTLPFVLIKLQF